MTAAAAIDRHQKVDVSSTLSNAKASPLEIFRERAEAKVLLIANGYEELQSAVDELWAVAERDGLVKALGADEVQWILSESFARWL
jgi:hypothetical protein